MSETLPLIVVLFCCILTRTDALRVKRGYGAKTIPLTDVQKMSIVQRHNDLRRKSGSSNMRYMTWDSELAWIAVNYGKKCQYKHNKEAKHSKIGSVGENIYASTGSVAKFVATNPVQMWYDEIVDFDHSSRKCTPGKKCGHYTQIVWATSYKVGCSLTECDTLSEIGWKNAHIFICNYSPAGNIVDFSRNLMTLFQSGTACSQCNTDTDYCRDSLCANSARDFIENPSEGEEETGKTSSSIITIPRTGTSTTPTPSQKTSANHTPGLIVAVVLLSLVVVLLIIFIVYRERSRIQLKVRNWKKNVHVPARFSNQNTPIPSRANTPRHSLVANNLHGLHRLGASDISGPMKQVKEEDKTKSASAPVTPQKRYTKGIVMAKRTPPVVPPPPLKH